VAGRYRERWFIKGGREIQGEMGYEVWLVDTGRDGSFSVDGRYRERWVIKGGREIQGDMGYKVWQGDILMDGL